MTDQRAEGLPEDVDGVTADVVRWQHGDVRPDDPLDLAIATSVACYTLDLALPNDDGHRYGHLSDGSALAITQHVLTRLRSLPVEQRMEAMGMTRGFCSLDGADEDGIGGESVFEPHPHGNCWQEAENRPDNIGNPEDPTNGLLGPAVDGAENTRS